MENEPTIFRVQFNSLLRNFTKMRGDIAAWNELVDTAHKFTFNSPHKTIIVTVDWNETKEFIAESVRYSLDPDKIKTQEDYDAFLESFEEYRRLTSIGLVKTNLEIEFSIYNSSNEYANFGYVINVLYQIFLVMNLSVPGSCDFYSVFIRSTQLSKSIRNEEVRFWLTGSMLEGLTELGERLQWVKIHNIPIKKTLSWIRRIGFSEAHFARSSTERAIFGLLHSCNEVDYITPTTLIWLVQALEALFDTPEAGISSTLRERVFLTLGKPSENRNKIKKAINSFYNYRSEYVHGELPIPNPMSMRLSDESLDEFTDELLEHINFAMMLIVASLQKLIMEDGDGFEFSEAVSLIK
jgi:Apea-like HEPN